MNLLCIYEIFGCIYEKISILIKSIYWHWQFECNHNWDFWKDKDKESDTNPLSHSTSLSSTPLFKNLFLITFLSELQISPINIGLTKNPSLTQNLTLLALLTQFLLHLWLQKIEKFLVITPYNQTSGLLIKRKAIKTMLLIDQIEENYLDLSK